MVLIKKASYFLKNTVFYYEIHFKDTEILLLFINLSLISTIYLQYIKRYNILQNILFSSAS